MLSNNFLTFFTSPKKSDFNVYPSVSMSPMTTITYWQSLLEQCPLRKGSRQVY